MLQFGEELYHSDCFKCKACSKSLDGCEFLMEENSIMCQECYTSKCARVCTRCNEAIMPDATGAIKAVEVDRINAIFHPTCYSCHECSSPFFGGAFPVGGKLFCKVHALEKNLSLTATDAPTCYACKKKGGARMLLAHQNHYHPECFVCAQCKESIDKKAFIPKDDNLFCKKCFTKYHTETCKACDSPISSNEEKDKGFFVKSAIGTYHKACFACVDCKKELTEDAGGAFPINDKLYCKKHAKNHTPSKDKVDGCADDLNKCTLEPATC